MANEQEAAQNAANGADAAHAAGEGADAAAHHPELPNFVHILHELFPDNALFGFMQTYINQVFIIIVIALLAFMCKRLYSNQSLVPNRFQAAVEILVEWLYDLVSSILDEKNARQYFPFIGALFVFILFSNLFGLIPLMRAPSASILVTGSLALAVFVYVQFIALTRLGPGMYFFHLMGEPRDTIGWCMVPLFLPLHIMEELIKPLSLACRLFGNIFGKDILLGVSMILGVSLMSVIGQASGVYEQALIGIPFQTPFLILGLLLSTIQALVFALLATVYISMVMPHEHHDHEEEPSITL